MSAPIVPDSGYLVQDDYPDDVECRACYRYPDEETCEEYEAEYRREFKERYGHEPEFIPDHDWGLQ
jgi:hypothetical protein